jgi:hypothetical protein
MLIQSQNHQGINSDRSSDGNSSEHSNSFSTARRSSSNFDGLGQDLSLSRSASPKKGQQFEDHSPSNFGELELSVRKKSGDPLRTDSFDISSRYSSRSQVSRSVCLSVGCYRMFSICYPRFPIRAYSFTTSSPHASVLIQPDFIG